MAQDPIGEDVVDKVAQVAAPDTVAPAQVVVDEVTAEVVIDEVTEIAQAVAVGVEE
ncbi:hypothetical protein Dimus_015822, partial [Dionaea muscipula]